MTPLNYILPGGDPGRQVLEGFMGGQQIAANRQSMDLRAAQEQRAQELQPYAVEGAALSNQAMAGNIEAQQQQMARAQQQQERQQRFQTMLSGLAQKGKSATTEDYLELISEFPEYPDAINEVWGTMDADRKQGQVEVMARTYAALKNGNVDLAVELGEQYARAAEKVGDAQGAATARAMVKQARANPDAALAQVGAALAVMDKDVLSRLAGGGEKTVREVQDFQNGASITYFSDGTRLVRDPAGRELAGTAAEQAIVGANAFEATQQGARAQARGQGGNVADILTGREAETERAIGRGLGTSRAENIAAAGGDIQRADSGISLIDSILSDPALGRVTGIVQGRLPATMMGQGAQDLAVKIEQLQGQAFLQAFEMLKGGGQITEREGAAATAAIARLQRTQSAEAFQKSLQELRDILQTARDRAEATRTEQSAAPTAEEIADDYSTFFGGGQ